VNASTSELTWEFFKPAASHDFIAVLGAIGDYKEKTPQIQGLIERYGERKVYPEALFLEWTLMVSEDSFKREVIEELAQGIAKAKSEEHLVTVKEAFGWLAVPAGRAPPLDPHP
jgi:hypothetical protein